MEMFALYRVLEYAKFYSFITKIIDTIQVWVMS
jgi:hypothetical protein